MLSKIRGGFDVVIVCMYILYDEGYVSMYIHTSYLPPSCKVDIYGPLL